MALALQHASSKTTFGARIRNKVVQKKWETGAPFAPSYNEFIIQPSGYTYKLSIFHCATFSSGFSQAKVWRGKSLRLSRTRFFYFTFWYMRRLRIGTRGWFGDNAPVSGPNYSDNQVIQLVVADKMVTISTKSAGKLPNDTPY